MPNTSRAALSILAAAAALTSLAVVTVASAGPAAVPPDVAKRVEQYKAIPSFVPPGPAFDASKARGKTIFVIPESSSIPFINTIDESIKRVAKLAGVKTTEYTN